MMVCLPLFPIATLRLTIPGTNSNETSCRRYTRSVQIRADLVGQESVRQNSKESLRSAGCHQEDPTFSRFCLRVEARPVRCPSSRKDLSKKQMSASRIFGNFLKPFVKLPSRCRAGWKSSKSQPNLALKVPGSLRN
ncbi:hypothetical protein C8R43DRAFT_678446 [Mycena crocata]|nr:hypothetical protein C8R43DRAFT_678446 [Mycena crocata]